MEIWLDTIDTLTIEKAHRAGILRGVTTTPAMLAAAAEPHETLKALLAAQPGPVAVEAGGDIVTQGKKLYEYSERIIVKVPVTESGLEAISTLAKAKVPVMASAIYHPTQALLAALAGATWVAPTFSRMLTSTDNPLALLEIVKNMATHYPFNTRLLAVHPKTIEQIRSCLAVGIEAITLREDLLKDLMETHELTAHAVEQSSEDWKKLLDKAWF